MTIVSLSGHEMGELLLSVAAAYLLALPLGWERKAKSHAYVGLRVFPLVSVSSCIYVFLGQRLFTGEHSDQQADVLHGLMAGIGFIGAGAIMKGRGEAHGIATAASIWNTGAIGASVAFGYYVVAGTLCVVSLLILEVMPGARRRARNASDADRGDGDRDGHETGLT